MQMHTSSSSKKNFEMKRYSIGPALVRRIFFLGLLLLTLPILIHSFFLYRTEYFQKRNDTLLTLKVIGEGQKALIEERLVLGWQEFDHPSDRTFTLIEYAGKDPLFASMSLEPGELVIGKQVDALHACIFKVPISEVLNSLSHFEEVPYPILIALKDAKGNITGPIARELSPPNSSWIQAHQHLNPSSFHLTKAKKPQKDPSLQSLIFTFPIEHSDFSLILSTPESTIQSLQNKDLLLHFGSLITALLLGGLLLFWVFSRRLIRPYKRFGDLMQGIIEGKSHMRYHPDWLGFEVNKLGKQFNQMLEQLAAFEREKHHSYLFKERKTEHLQLTRQIQSDLLPKEPFHLAGFDCHSGFLPSQTVSGHFYNLFELDHGAYLWILGDVQGHELGSPLFAHTLKGAFKALTKITHDPAKIADQLHKLFSSAAREQKIEVLCWIGVYHPSSRILHYCCFGDLPVFVKTAGQTEHLITQDPPFHHPLTTKIHVKKIAIEEGDLLLLSTQGSTHLKNPLQEPFGKERLENWLFHIDSKATILPLLEETLCAFSHGMLQQEDILLVCLRAL